MSTFMESFLIGEFGDVRDREAESEGAEGVQEDRGVFMARDICDGTPETMEGTCEHLDLVIGTREGVCIFDRSVGEVEDVTKTLNLPVRHPSKGGIATGSGGGRGVHDVAGEQEALFEYILTMTLVNTDENLARDDHPFLDVACTVGPIDEFLLGGHVCFHLIGKTIRVVEDLPANEFVVPFDLCDVPCRGVERLLFEIFRYASGARP